jgi:glutamyl-tRNA synthetase
LQWCGITFDEGVHLGGPHAPYRQSERKELYRSYAEQLVQNGHAYYAFDTEEELDEMREKLKSANVASPQYNSITRVNMKNSLTLPNDEVERRLKQGDEHVIRFRMPRNEEVKVKDIIRGWVVVNTSQLDDKILFKSDGMPTYHLANVVDDYLMQISHVIRGEEWLPSTPLHVLLYRAFGWEEAMPEFAHLPLLLKPDGDGKLSKRDGDRLGLPFYAISWKNPETGETTEGYREAGYFPEAYVNFLAFLGWNPGDNREMFSLNELVESFSIERVHKHGARYDFNKLRWFNQHYLRLVSDDALAKMIQPIVEAKGYGFNKHYLMEVCRLMKERWVLVSDFWESSSFFFHAPEKYDEAIVAKKWNVDTAIFMSDLANSFRNLTTFHSKDVEECFIAQCTKAGIKQGAVMQSLRLALSGQGAGPAIYEMAALLGQEECIQRLEKAVKDIR